jgi:outer membrane immunogenic protein
LFSATGGPAFTTLNANFTETDTSGDSEFAPLSASKTGYAIGGGVEAALWQQWSVKVEYLHAGFGRVATTGILLVAGTPSGQPINNSIDLNTDIVRVGLNYRFH